MKSTQEPKRPTDLACQKFLAEQDARIQLVEITPSAIGTNQNDKYLVFRWKKDLTRVHKTSWAQIALDVVKKLRPSDFSQYIFNLSLILKEYWKSQGKKVDWTDDENMLMAFEQASYQQRAIAFAGLMGKELV